jgi:hypothetical protein
MEILLNDQRQSYRLNVPVLLSHQLLTNNEFKAMLMSLQKNKSFFNKNSETVNLAREIKNDISAIQQQEKGLVPQCAEVIEKTDKLLHLLSSYKGEFDLYFTNERNEIISLSLGGIAFKAASMLPANARLVLEITLLPSDRKIHVLCEVIKSSAADESAAEGEINNGYQVQAKFEAFNENDEQALSDFLEKFLLQQRKEKQKV